jgi:Outer membrane protein
MLRSIRRHVVVWFLAGFAPFVSAQAPSSLPVPEDYFPGLKSLLETALQQSPRMVARNAEEAISEAARREIRAGQLPTIGGYASYYPYARERRGEAPDPVTVGNNEKVAYNFSLNQAVFHWGALRNNTKIAELRQKMAEGSTAEAYRMLVEQIRAQYLALVVSKMSLTRARFNQQVAEDALALARSRRERNVISEADLFTPTIAAEQARLTTDRVEFEYENGRVYLGKLCGLEAIPDEQIPAEIPAVSPDSAEVERVISSFTGQGEPDTFYMRNLRRGIEVEKLSYKIADTRLKPKVNAQVGVSQDEQTFAFGTNTSRYKIQSTYAGVSINWTIFDSFATRQSKIASLTRRRELERAYKEQAGDLLRTVQNQKRLLEFSARALAIAEKLLGSSENGVRVAEEDLSRGVGSQASVDAARLHLYTRRLEAYAARNDYLLKVSNLLSTTLNDPALNLLPAKYR